MIINNLEKLKQDIQGDHFLFGDEEIILDDIQAVIEGLENAIETKDYCKGSHSGYIATIDLDEDTNKLINFEIENDGSITILLD